MDNCVYLRYLRNFSQISEFVIEGKKRTTAQLLNVLTNVRKAQISYFHPTILDNISKRNEFIKPLAEMNQVIADWSYLLTEN